MSLTRIQAFAREYFPTIANNSTDAEHDLDIGASRLWVSNGTDELLIDFAARIKRIDAAWAAGTNQGGLDTGTVANNTWYYVYAIYNPTTNVADYLLSASATSPTLPSGYIYSRFLCAEIAAAVRTNSSANILAMTWHKRQCQYAAIIDGDYVSSTPSVGRKAMTIPSGFPVVWEGAIVQARNSGQSYFGVGTISFEDTATTLTGFATSVLTIDGQIYVSYFDVSGTLALLKVNTTGYRIP
jgi:hypothetical protein